MIKLYVRESTAINDRRYDIRNLSHDELFILHEALAEYRERYPQTGYIYRGEMLKALGNKLVA